MVVNLLAESPVLKIKYREKIESKQGCWVLADSQCGGTRLMHSTASRTFPVLS